MFRATFDIKPESISTEEMLGSLLLMEVSGSAFSYVIYHKSQQRFLVFRQYSLDYNPGKTNLETFRDILQQDDLLQHEFRESYIVYNYADSNLLPEKYFHIELNKPAIELVYGNARKGLLLSEKVYGWELYNTYRIPREVHTVLQQKFAAGKYWHYYTLLLTGIAKESSAKDDEIKMVVAADHYVVAVFRNGELQLLQTWYYQTPEDVSYYLLSVCHRFYLNPEEVKLSISGLVDEESNLYQEIMKYFLQTSWEVLPDTVSLQESFSEFPRHYFSPLLKMALCV
jgi:hypothetical protein